MCIRDRTGTSQPSRSSIERANLVSKTFSGVSGKRLSLDHLVGDGKQAGSNRYSKRLRCFQVDDEFELGRHCDREVFGSVALDDAAGVNGHLAIGIRQIDPIAHQPSRFGKIAIRVHDGYAGCFGERYDSGASQQQERIGTYQQRSYSLLFDRRKGCFEVLIAGSLEWLDFDAKTARGGLNVRKLFSEGWRSGIEQHAEGCRLRQQVVQQANPLRFDGGAQYTDAGDVVAGTTEAVDETATYGIGGKNRHDRRFCPGANRRPGSRLASNRKQNGDRATEEFRGQCGKPVIV